MEALVDVEVRDVSHLSKVIAGLRGASGIKGSSGRRHGRSGRSTGMPRR